VATPAWGGVLAPSAGPPSITFSTPAADGAVITTAPVNLSGVVSRPGGDVANVQVTVAWTDTVANRPKAAHPSQGTIETPPSGQSSYAWGYPAVLGSNGRYTVSIVADTDDGTPSNQEQTPASESFIADVPPVAPTNLTYQLSRSRTVTLTWSPNPEADLIGYDVLRAGPTSSDAPVLLNGVLAPATTYTDKEVASEPRGTYRYEVIAVRPNGDGTGTDKSAPSFPAAATIDSAAIAPPTPVAPSSPGTSGTVTSTPNAVVETNGPTGVTSDNPSVVLPGTAPILPSFTAPVVEEPSVTTAPSSGYSPNLPYKPLTANQPTVTAPPATVTTPLGPADGRTNSHQTLEFVAGALLLAVLGLFAWMLKRSVDQGVPLEAVTPAADDSLLLTILSPVAATPPPAEQVEEFEFDTFNADVVNLFASLRREDDDLFDWEHDSGLADASVLSPGS
jgi:hypothetical protein